MDTFEKIDLNEKLQKALLDNKVAFVMKEDNKIILLEEFENKDNLTNYLNTEFKKNNIDTFEYRTGEHAYLYSCNSIYEAYLEDVLANIQDDSGTQVDVKNFLKTMLSYDEVIEDVSKDYYVNGIYVNGTSELICELNLSSPTKGTYTGFSNCNISFEIY